MKILHVIQSLDPQTGGPPMIAAKIAAAQAGLGHEVSLCVVRSPGREAAIAGSLQGIPAFPKVNIVELPPQGRIERLLAMRGRNALQPLVKQADAVHLHNVWESILRVAASLARKYRKPYFVLLNGMLDPWSLSQKRLKKQVALALAVRRMLNGAAALHVGNADEKNLIRPLGIKAPSVTIPNGVFLEEVSDLPQRGTFYAAHPELHNAPYILFLSRLHYKKGLDYLAQAFAIVARETPDVQLVVAGPDGGERAKFVQWIAEAGVSARVHLVGPLYGRDKLAALVDATCFCLPSRQEGFSVAITEALGCGVPVVITEGCHFPQIAEVGAGEVTPLDANAVAHALIKVLGDAELRCRMSAAGRQLVESQLTWPIIAQKTVAMYRDALNGKITGD